MHPNTLQDRDMFSTSFQRLNPLCVEIAKNCSIENIDRLEAELEEISDISVQTLQQYIIFPFQIALCRKYKERIKIRCITFLRCVFNRVDIQSWEQFSSIFTQLFVLLIVPEDIDKVSDASEELKLCACQCGTTMVQKSSEEIVKSMYDLPFRLNLSQAFYTLINLLKNEKSKELRVVVINFIGILSYGSDYFVSRSQEVEVFASDCLASTLPGLSLALRNVICGDSKEGQEVICASLNVLSDLIVITCNDNCIDDNKKPNYMNVEKYGNVPRIEKTEKWCKEVSEKIGIVINQINATLSTHPHWKVRIAFLKFIERILCKCIVNLNDSVPTLLRTLFAFSVDSYKQVSSYSHKIIKLFHQQFNSVNSRSLVSVIESDIYTLTSNLIKSRLLTNDSYKLLVLETLQSYLLILESSKSNILHSVPHLEKITLSLLNLLEFDTSSMNFIVDVSMPLNFDDFSQSMWPKKRFRYFQDETVLNKIGLICGILGHNEDARMLVDYLLEKLKNSEYPLQCVYMLTQFVKGFSDEFAINNMFRETNTDNPCIEQKTPLIKDILEELSSIDLWELHICDAGNTEQSSSALSVKENNDKIFQTCLTIEAVAACSQVLKDGFKIFLKNILCLVLEKAGNQDMLISTSGKICLNVISQSCGYISIMDMIRDNADYIVNSLTINFQYFIHKPESATVLCVVLNIGNIDMLTLFKDPIYQIMNTLDYNQEKAFQLMSILSSVASCINKWVASEKDVHTDLKSKIQSLKGAFLDFHELKLTELSFKSDYADIAEATPSTENIESINHQDPSDKKQLPLHVNVIIEIMNRCVHHQSTKDRTLCVLVLETIELCILSLKDFNDELLPLVHNLWDPFLYRFSDDPIITMKAFKVLLVMAKECKDFIRTRTLKSILPKLTTFLDKEFNSSLKKNFRNYKWANAHKLQLCILSEIGSLAFNLDLSTKELPNVANSCLPYLSNKQPLVLQNAAAKSVKDLSNIDSDAMWLYFNEVYNKTKVLLPPHEDFCEFRFLHSNTDCDIEFDF